MGITRLFSEPAGLGNHRCHGQCEAGRSSQHPSRQRLSPGRGLLVPTAAYPQSENSWFNFGKGEAAEDPRVAQSAQCRYCQDFKVCFIPASLLTGPQPMAGRFSFAGVTKPITVLVSMCDPSSQPPSPEAGW